MSSKTIIALIVIGLILAGAVGFGVWYFKSGEGAPREEAVATEPQAPAPSKVETPANILVPEVSSTASVPANFAKPSVVADAAPNMETKFRIFNLSVEKNKVAPDTLAVYLGDTVHVEIVAVDKDYNLVQPDYSFKWNLSKGASKTFEFGAVSEGKFSFFCESCPNSENIPVAYLVVVKK